MELSQFYNLPFTKSAAEYVDSSEVGLLDVIQNPLVYGKVLSRAEGRLVQALGGDIEKPVFGEGEEDKMDVELLSYPVARLLLSCTGDKYAIRRYALKEAKSSTEFLKSRLFEMGREETSLFLSQLAADLELKFEPEGAGLFMPIHYYLRCAGYIHEPEWKLVNRQVSGGMVLVPRSELEKFVAIMTREKGKPQNRGKMKAEVNIYDTIIRLLQEVIRAKVEEGMPIEVEKGICKMLSVHTGRIKQILAEKRARFEQMNVRGPEGIYPPCMREAMRLAREGMNLPHSQRFALTSFLLTIGWSVEEVVGLFASSPDFDEKLATYQIEHIAGSTGTTYTPPSCATMQTYGNCIGRDANCAGINHPLTYYRWQLRRMK
ncbi:MAG: hypothetical protein ACXQT1_01895 [Methermicoccaceae archaeon]